jgi:hypothetical protein
MKIKDLPDSHDIIGTTVLFEGKKWDIGHAWPSDNDIGFFLVDPKDRGKEKIPLHHHTLNRKDFFDMEVVDG